MLYFVLTDWLTARTARLPCVHRTLASLATSWSAQAVVPPQTESLFARQRDIYLTVLLGTVVLAAMRQLFYSVDPQEGACGVFIWSLR